MTDYTSVAARAMLVSLHVSTWAARRFDRKVSDKVNAEAKADKDAGRWNKHLLAGSTEHAAVMKASGELRDVHYHETLPWADEGTRLLPTMNYFRYTEAIRKKMQAFDRAVAAFMDAYPTLKAEAPTKLGTMYREEDFPEVNRVRVKFARTVDFGPVPAGGDIRVDLPADQLAVIEAQVQARMEQAAKDAMRGAWERLREAVARIQKASAKDGVVRGNLIEHAREVVDVLGRLNVSQDEALESMRQRVLRELTVIEPEDLRKDEKLRVDTERRANEIMTAMGALYAPSSEAATEAA